MAKICPQCGVKYKNSATKCVMCGTEFGDAHIYKKKKKFVILGIVGAVLLAAAITLIILSTGPRAAVWRLMNDHKRNDVEAIVESFPDFLLESDKMDREAFLREVEYVSENFSKYILSFNVEQAKDPSSMECEELMELFRYIGGDDFNEADVEDIKTVWVNYKGNVTGFWPSHATRFIVIQYQGRWCWWPSNVSR